MVTSLLKEVSHIFQRMVTDPPQDDHPLTVEWSPPLPKMIIPFPRMVTHHFQDVQIDLEFDPSAA